MAWPERLAAAPNIGGLEQEAQQLLPLGLTSARIQRLAPSLKRNGETRRATQWTHCGLATRATDLLFKLAFQCPSDLRHPSAEAQQQPISSSRGQVLSCSGGLDRNSSWKRSTAILCFTRSVSCSWQPVEGSYYHLFCNGEHVLRDVGQTTGNCCGWPGSSGQRFF